MGQGVETHLGPLLLVLLLMGLEHLHEFAQSPKGETVIRRPNSTAPGISGPRTSWFRMNSSSISRKSLMRSSLSNRSLHFDVGNTWKAQWGATTPAQYTSMNQKRTSRTL